ncbi:hypothetical protein [Labilibacter marinus]|uniref:hypothetical protein n=1 Tax=Labilibacter marinus TaxID=1477105 RepID=UPI00094F608A|nr:hypothetical protein [Labilibacter marinus]
MKMRILFALTAALIMTSCVSTMNYTWQKEGFEGKNFKKILVVATSKNLESRTTLENTVVGWLAKEGINAENSLSLFPPFVDIKELDEKTIESKIKAGGYDAVLVSSLIDVNEQDVYEQGSNYYPMHYGYRRYIYNGYGYAYSPGYYRQQKTYVVESRLFDTAKENAKEAIVWSGQSSLTDPSSYESGAKQYASTLVKTLLKSNTIK